MNVSNNWEPIFMGLISGAPLLTIMVGSTDMPILDKNDRFCLYFNPDTRKRISDEYKGMRKRRVGTVTKVTTPQWKMLVDVFF